MRAYGKPSDGYLQEVRGFTLPCHLGSAALSPYTIKTCMPSRLISLCIQFHMLAATLCLYCHCCRLCRLRIFTCGCIVGTSSVKTQEISSIYLLYIHGKTCLSSYLGLKTLSKHIQAHKAVQIQLLFLIQNSPLFVKHRNRKQS